MMQVLCRFRRGFEDLFQKEGRFALKPLSFAFVQDYQCPAAGWAGLGKWFFPGSETAVRIIGATVEYPPLTGFAFHQIAAIFRAGNAYLLQEGLGMPAGGEGAAADKLAKAPIAVHQFIAAQRAGTP